MKDCLRNHRDYTAGGGRYNPHALPFAAFANAVDSLLAIRSTLKGLNKLIVHREKIIADLDNNWAVVAEAIQTVLRREGYPNPYETLKALTRTNAKITKESIREFIDTLDVPENVKDELRGFSPLNYTGY